MKSSSGRRSLFGQRRTGRDYAEATPGGWRTENGYELSEQLAALSSGTPAEAAFGALANELLAQHLAVGRRGTVICAASRGVGVTLTATNLAIALSRAGASTLLVDGNLRDPAVERLIRPPADGLGLGELLGSETLTLGDILHADVLPGLSVVYAGVVDVTSVGGASSGKFPGFAKACLRDFDCTIFDTPSANRSTDARAMAVAVGYAMIVARRGASYAKDVSFLRDQLEQDGVLIVGSVLNGG